MHALVAMQLDVYNTLIHLQWKNNTIIRWIGILLCDCNCKIINIERRHTQIMKDRDLDWIDCELEILEIHSFSSFLPWDFFSFDCMRFGIEIRTARPQVAARLQLNQSETEDRLARGSKSNQRSLCQQPTDSSCFSIGESFARAWIWRFVCLLLFNRNTERHSSLWRPWRAGLLDHRSLRSMAQSDLIWQRLDPAMAIRLSLQESTESKSLDNGFWSSSYEWEKKNCGFLRSNKWIEVLCESQWVWAWVVYVYAIPWIELEKKVSLVPNWKHTVEFYYPLFPHRIHG